MDHRADPMRLQNLLIRLVENDLDDSELNFLMEWSRTHPEAVREYCEFLKDYSLVRNLVSGEVDWHMDTAEEARFNEAVWKALQEVENTAPGIRLAARRKPERATACPLPEPEARPRVSRLSLAAILLSSAALICLIVYAHFAAAAWPVEAATLTESLGAKWSNSNRALQDGMRLLTNSKPLWLREGMATIDFDAGGRVVLEGPAEFEVLGDNQIHLHYGNLYAIIPPQAVGFTVDTDHSKIIDLGTEFGTRVDPDGGIEVHVIEGKTILLAGSPDGCELTEGQARAVTPVGEVRDIAVSREAFIRLFDPQSGFVWKGRDAVDLADMVGGGSGFGTGRIEHGLDPLTGKAVELITPRYSIHGSGRYQVAADNPFVDGVFVPDGGEGPIVVSSRGDRFAACPDTNGEFWTEITNGGQLSDPVELSSPQFRLQGREYGTADCPAIFMHANLGVTFDLEAIRRSLPRLKITGFEALAGISENGPRRNPYADFRVLVDGEERFCRAGADGMNVYPVFVEIDESDRFLTLMVTDGGTERCLMVDGVPYVLDGDWGLFAMPRLRITTEEESQM